MNSSAVPPTSTSSLAPMNTADSSSPAALHEMMQSWLQGKSKAPTQPVQAKRARLLKKLSDLTSFQQQSG